MADLTLATLEGVIDLSRKCDSDLSSKQYYIVKHDSAEDVVISGAADKSLGVLQNAPDGSSNDAVAQVRIQGVTKVKSAATIAFGDYITPDANGAAVVAGAGENYIGYALTSADSGDLFSMKVVNGAVES